MFNGQPAVYDMQPAGTPIGTFATLPTTTAPFTYTLVSGAGSTGNASFSIAGNVLQTAQKLTYAVQPSYTIRVRTTDEFGHYVESIFAINVIPSITGIGLSPASIIEASPVGTVVGQFTTQPSLLQPFTYALVSGTGSGDNGSFTISGNQLKTAAVFDYTKQKNCLIRVRSTSNIYPGSAAEANITIPVLAKYLPDLLISNDNGNTWTGQGVFGTDGTNQISTLTCPANSYAAFYVAVMNSGCTADSYKFALSLNSAWNVYSYDCGVTPATQFPINTSTWTTPIVPPGQFRIYAVYTMPGSTVTAGSAFPLVIRATSVGNPSRLDAVLAMTTLVLPAKP